MSYGSKITVEAACNTSQVICESGEDIFIRTSIFWKRKIMILLVFKLLDGGEISITKNLNVKFAEMKE